MMKKRRSRELFFLVAFAMGGLSWAPAGCKATSSSGRSNTTSGGEARGEAREGPVARPAPDMGTAPARRAPRRAPRRASARAVSHAPLGALLGRYVDARGRVGYKRWMRSASDTKALARYLARLAAVDPSGMPRSEQKAFWINAYNANVLRGVMDKLAADSSFVVSRKGFAFFDEVRYKVAGQRLSLNEMENGVLRGDFGHKSLGKTPAPRLALIRGWHKGVGKVDPRIHFALVCASVGCPNLRAGAYRGVLLEAQLQADTTAYINDPTKGAGPKGISAIFSWFKKDFLAVGLPPRRFIAKYYKSDISKVRFSKEIKYSWDLNRQ